MSGKGGKDAPFRPKGLNPGRTRQRGTTILYGATVMAKVLRVPGSSILYRPSDKGGWEWSDDGATWYFTFRNGEEIKAMHPGITEDADATPNTPDEDAERELFGETLDDPIPDDLWDMIKNGPPISD